MNEEKKVSWFRKIYMGGSDVVKSGKANRAEKNLQQKFVQKHMELVNKLSEQVDDLFKLRENLDDYSISKVINLKNEISEVMFAAKAVVEEYTFMFGTEMTIQMTIEDALGDNIDMLSGLEA